MIIIESMRMTESLFHVVVVGYHASQGALLRTTIIIFLDNIVIIIIICRCCFVWSCFVCVVPLIPRAQPLHVTYVVCCVSLGRGVCQVVFSMSRILFLELRRYSNKDNLCFEFHFPQDRTLQDKTRK